MESNRSVLSRLVKTRPEYCRIHGQYSAIIIGDAASTCPICLEEAEKKKREADAETRKRLAFTARLNEAGIPRRFHDATFENYQVSNHGQKLAAQRVMRYTANFSEALKAGQCLALVGNPGTGKTHLAASAAREVIAQGHTARLTTVGDYVREIKDFCWGKNKPRTESEVIAEFCRPDLLVLDEIGVQFGTATEENLTFVLINKRYEDMKPTLIVSNEDEEGLERYLGARTFDRITENGGQIIGFGWESFRGSKRWRQEEAA